MLFQFLCQSDTDLHTVDEAVAFVVAAEGADWIYDLIHLTERHAVHQFVQLVEGGLQLGVPFEQFLYRRLFRLLPIQGDSLCHVGLDDCGDIFHKTHLQKVFVMLPWKCQNCIMISRLIYIVACDSTSFFS